MQMNNNLFDKIICSIGKEVKSVISEQFNISGMNLNNG